MNASIHKLVHLWSSWLQVVDDVARRHRRARRLVEDDYQELHQNLLAELDVQIARCKSAEHTLPKEMHRLVAPWLTLDSLLVAERHVLTVLLGQAKRAQQRLDRRVGRRRRWVMIAIPIIILLLTALIVTWLIAMWDSGDIAWLIRQWQHWGYRLQRAVTKANLLTKIGMFALIIVAMGCFFLRSMRQD